MALICYLKQTNTTLRDRGLSKEGTFEGSLPVEIRGNMVIGLVYTTLDKICDDTQNIVPLYNITVKTLDITFKSLVSQI